MEPWLGVLSSQRFQPVWPVCKNAVDTASDETPHFTFVIRIKGIHLEIMAMRFYYKRLFHLLISGLENPAARREGTVNIGFTGCGREVAGRKFWLESFHH